MSELIPAALNWNVDGYVVAKFSAWREAPGPTWVHPAFDIERGEWREGEQPPPNQSPWGVIDESGEAAKKEQPS